MEGRGGEGWCGEGWGCEGWEGVRRDRVGWGGTGWGGQGWGGMGGGGGHGTGREGRRAGVGKCCRACGSRRRGRGPVCGPGRWAGARERRAGLGSSHKGPCRSPRPGAGHTRPQDRLDEESTQRPQSPRSLLRVRGHPSVLTQSRGPRTCAPPALFPGSSKRKRAVSPPSGLSPLGAVQPSRRSGRPASVPMGAEARAAPGGPSPGTFVPIRAPRCLLATRPPLPSPAPCTVTPGKGRRGRVLSRKRVSPRPHLYRALGIA